MRIVGRLPMNTAVSCGQTAENAEKRAAPCIMTRSALLECLQMQVRHPELRAHLDHTYLFG